jgi:predicted AAA+ superfamily ATPase
MVQTMPRLLKIKLPKGQSAFLWGPRKTGKTTFLRVAFPDSLSYDLLQTDLFLEFVKRLSCSMKFTGLSKTRASGLSCAAPAQEN